MLLQVGAHRGIGRLVPVSGPAVADGTAGHWITPGGIPVSFQAHPFRSAGRSTDPRDLWLYHEHARLSRGKRRLVTTSAGFVARIEQRLARDRQRLHDYYRELSREAGHPGHRAAAAPAPDEIAAQQRAVDLELRRKLVELSENYALRAELRPVTLARMRVPALVVPVTIQRKQATRDYRVYGNSFARKLEPLSCARCRRATFAATFNNAVDLLCTVCAEKG